MARTNKEVIRGNLPGRSSGISQPQIDTNSHESCLLEIEGQKYEPPNKRFVKIGEIRGPFLSRSIALSDFPNATVLK